MFVLAKSRFFVFVFAFEVHVLFCLFSVVKNTSAIDWLERLVFEMTMC